MAIRKNGRLTTTIPGQFDGQIHSIEWFHNGAWRRIIDTVYPLQDAEILDDTLDCGGFCFINELEPYPDKWETDASGNVITDADGNKIDNTNSIKFLKQLTPIRILWDSNEDYKSITDDMTAAQKAEAKAFNEDLELQVRGKKPVKEPIWRYRVVDEINIHGEGRIFKFAVKTVEATKLLELVQCDTLTFTNYLIRNEILPMSIYAVGIPYYPTESNAKVGFKQNVIKTPFKVGSNYTLPFAKDVFNMKKGVNYVYYAIFVKSPSSNEKKRIFYSNHSVISGWKDQGNRTVNFNECGRYMIYYEITMSISTGGQVLSGVTGYRFDVEVYEEIPIHTSLTIPRVLERILYAGETRRDGIEEGRFVLDGSVKEKFYKTHSPEFCITRATMWEALKMVAGHVHCVPRLNWDDFTNTFRIVTFDELGGMEECKLKAMHNNKPIAWDVRKSLDSYCGELNTYVDNLVNTRDDIAGCIVEPYEGGWKSARAKDGELIVSDDTVVFNMSRPNMRVSKLEIKYGDKEADITKYLFEAAEYKALSTLEGDYPRATGRALKVEQGGKEITEIARTSQAMADVGFGVGGIFAIESIINIASSEGISIASGKFKDIQYRVTYSPISSARIVQDKPYLEDCSGYSRNYNVAGNMIESEYLGEHLKGAIARVGNDIEYRTYMFERAKDVPQPGTILDGKYIMKVTTEMSTVRFIKATLVLSSDYNQKHEYVAIDSSIRYYDVSEKQSVERHVNYRERVIIGDEIETSENTPMITPAAVDLFSKVFISEATDEQVSWAWFKGSNSSQIFLPCLSQAEGNSLIFNFACQDNFGAGWRIDNENVYSAIQTQVAYADTYGEFEKLEVIFGNVQNLKNMSLPDDMPKKLPLWTSTVKPVGIFSTGENPLIISKDSREQLNITYQLNSVANRKGIILGSALNSNNPLITATQLRKIKCYWLPRKINKFAPIIDVSDGAEVHLPVSICIENMKFYLPVVQNLSDIDAEAIAWVDVTDGIHNAKLLIGENRAVGAGELSREIWFNFNANE